MVWNIVKYCKNCSYEIVFFISSLTLTRYLTILKPVSVITISKGKILLRFLPRESRASSTWVAPVYGPRHSRYSYYLCRALDIAAVGTILNVFSYDAVLGRESNLSPPGKANALRVEPRSRVIKRLYYTFIHALE